MARPVVRARTQTSVAGSKQALPTVRSTGFTLLELLVVLAIVAIATAGATLALRDPAASALQRDAQRLAVVLDSGRAQSRARGVGLTWQVASDGFVFAGATPGSLPHNWLDSATQARTRNAVLLGPEPIIGPQEIVLTRADAPKLQWRVWTDGLQPFAAEALQDGE